MPIRSVAEDVTFRMGHSSEICFLRAFLHE